MSDPTFTFRVIPVCARNILQTTSIVRDGRKKVFD